MAGVFSMCCGFELCRLASCGLPRGFARVKSSLKSAVRMVLDMTQSSCCQNSVKQWLSYRWKRKIASATAPELCWLPGASCKNCLKCGDIFFVRLMLCISSVLGYHISMLNFVELGNFFPWFTGLSWIMGLRAQADSEPVNWRLEHYSRNWAAWWGECFRIYSSDVSSLPGSVTLHGKKWRNSGLSERERVRAIYDLISTMTFTFNYSHVLDAALDLGGKSFVHWRVSRWSGSSALCCSFTHAENGKTELRVGSARRFTPSDTRIFFRGRRAYYMK